MTRRRRYRRHRRASLRRQLRRYLRRTDPRILTAVVVVILVAASGGAAAHQASHHHATSGTIPAGSAYTQASWARALLTAGGWPLTTCNLNAVVSWENAEGGNWGNDAQFNPLDTTEQEPGSWAVNTVDGVHVQGYPSWQTGFAATLTTLNNGFYPTILAALTTGNDAQSVADAVTASPWGTEPFTATC